MTRKANWSQKRRELVDAYRLIQSSECTVCRKCKASVRYTFFTSSLNMPNCRTLNFVCSVNCAIYALLKAVEVGHSYNGLWLRERRA